MVDYKLLESLEQECSAIVCPDCGGQHKVSLDVTGSIVTYSCPGAEHCPGFHGALNKYLKSRANALTAVAMPFPFP